MAPESLSAMAAIALPSSCRTGHFFKAARAEKSDITLQALCDRLSAERGVKADTSMMSRFFRKIGVTFKNVWPAPSARGFAEIAG
jgi:transposase